MKGRVVNLLIVVASLFGYLQWGGGSSAFLFQAEAEILGKLFVEPADVLHPLTLVPLAGQLILLVTVFQQEPRKLLTYLGIAAIGVLFLLILIAGVIGSNIRMIVSTAPFMLMSIYAIMLSRKQVAPGSRSGQQH